MTTTNRLAQLEKIGKPKLQDKTAQVVIYKAGEDLKTKVTASSCVIFIPSNSRDTVTTDTDPQTDNQFEQGEKKL